MDTVSPTSASSVSEALAYDTCAFSDICSMDVSEDDDDDRNLSDNEDRESATDAKQLQTDAGHGHGDVESTFSVLFNDEDYPSADGSDEECSSACSDSETSEDEPLAHVVRTWEDNKTIRGNSSSDNHKDEDKQSSTGRGEPCPCPRHQGAVPKDLELPTEGAFRSRSGSSTGLFLKQEIAKPSWRCLWRRCPTGHLPEGDPRCYSLSRHIQRQRAASNGQKVLCGWGSCEETFVPSGNSLRRHVLGVHLGYQSWQCPYCKRELARLNTTKRHYKTCKKAPEHVRLDAKKGLPSIRLDGMDSTVTKHKIAQSEPDDAQLQGGPLAGSSKTAHPITLQPTEKRKRMPGVWTGDRRSSGDSELESGSNEDSEDDGDGEYRPSKRLRMHTTKTNNAARRWNDRRK